MTGVTTETGAGQWGTALSMACSYFGLDCKVYMVKVPYEQKPFRREVMRTYGASVTPSPSTETQVGRKILAEHPGTTGSLGCAISEAVEVATSTPGYRYVLGSVLNQVLLHQSVIGLESKAALGKYGIKPDIIIGCAGGGSNLGELISPFMGEKLRGEQDYRIIAVEPASCPLPNPATPSVWLLTKHFAAGRAERKKTILFGLTGTGYFDMVAYEKFHNGEMSDYIPTDADLQAGFDGIPKFPGNEID